MPVIRQKNQVKPIGETMDKPILRSKLFRILLLILIVASVVYLKPIKDKKDFSYALTKEGVIRIDTQNSITFTFGREVDLSSFSLGFADKEIEGSSQQADVVYRFFDGSGNTVYEREVPLDVILDEDIYTIDVAGDGRQVSGVEISVTNLAEGDTVGLYHDAPGRDSGNAQGDTLLFKGEDIDASLSSILGTPSRYRILFAGVIAFLLALFCAFAFWIYGHAGLTVEKAFVVLAATFGILIVLLQPQFQGFDEYAHFYRAFHVSEGNLSVVEVDGKRGGILTDDIAQSYNTWFVQGMPYGLDQKINTEKHLEVFTKPRDEGSGMYVFGNTSQYRFTSYLPSALGIFLADTAGLPIAWVLLVGRLFNFMAWLLIIWCALRVMPFQKELILLVSFLPIHIIQAASLSPDGLLNSLSILLVAYVLKKMKEGKGGLKSFLIIAGISVFLASIKLPYILLGLFGLLIPIRRHHERIRAFLRRHRMGLAGAGVLLLVLAVAIVFLSRRFIQLETIQSNTLAGLITIVQDPVFFINTLLRTIVFNLQRYTEILVGVIGWNYRAMPFTLTYGYIGILLLVVFRNDGQSPENALKPLEKGFSTLLIIGLILGIFVVGFTWNLEADQTIWGIQGRYFIPVVLPFLLLLDSKHIRATFENSAVYLFGAWTLAYTVMTMVSRYYF